MRALSVIVGIIIVQAAHAQVLRPPYEVGKSKEYFTTITVADMGLEVIATLQLSPSARSENGIKALFRWTSIEVEGQPLEGWDIPVTLGKRGELVSAESEYGQDTRRMHLPFFFVYPPDDLGDKKEWTYDYKPATDGDGPAYSATYRILGTEAIAGEDTTKVSVDLKEEGSNGMTIKGSCWIGKDGWVRKFDLTVQNWPVVQMGQSITVRMMGTQKSQ